jgi:6-pyruvoyltetrahydropterin/6-carboxytetrahydropterin synthase
VSEPRIERARPKIGYATIAKTFRFEAAHVLPDHDGKCSSLHGHSYKVLVECHGPIRHDPGHSENGMVVDFAYLQTFWRQNLHPLLDHAFLNQVVPEPYLPTTAENLACFVFDEFACAWPQTSAVTVWETENSWARVCR